MPRNFASLSLAVLVLVLSARTAAAGPLLSDSTAILHSHQVFTGNIGGALSANVEYAVYAPGTVENSPTLGLPGFAMDPSHGTDYVYAYEIFNGAGSSVNATITQLSVSLRAGTIPLGSTNIGFDSVPDPGGISPNPAGNLPHFNPLSPPSLSLANSAVFAFGSPFVGPNQHSDILFFTSPFPPEMHTSSLLGPVPSTSQNLPRPAPEPATATLSIVAAVCLWVVTRLRAGSARAMRD